MGSLLLAALFFDGIHFGISGTRLRGALVARLGLTAYLGLFSLVSALGLAWLCLSYAQAGYVGLWGQLYALRPVALAAMLAAFLLVVPGVTTPAPTAAGGEALLDREDAARGILRVTRHPFLMGVALWALVHLLVNGDLASFLFFGSLLALGVGGPPSIDRKRRHARGERWERFAGITSILPFGAIAAGRNRLVLSEIGAWRIALALTLYVALLLAHAPLFGVSPLPA